MQSLPLYEAKPATLGVTVRQSAKMSLFIVIDLRQVLQLRELQAESRLATGAPAPRAARNARKARRVGGRLF